MNKNNDPKTLVNFINCLGVLEDDTARLYKNISMKVEPPILKSLLLSISEDSLKHFTLLRGVADSIMKTSEKPRNCEKNTGEIWRLLAKLNKEVDSKKSFSDEELSEVSRKLAFLESIMGEEYYIFVQLKTLEIMVKEINQLYHIDLESLKSVFTHIINDEEHHREIIGTIQSSIGPKQIAGSSPFVKYTNPDNWISHSRQTT